MNDKNTLPAEKATGAAIPADPALTPLEQIHQWCQKRRDEQGDIWGYPSDAEMYYAPTNASLSPYLLCAQASADLNTFPSSIGNIELVIFRADLQTLTDN